MPPITPVGKIYFVVDVLEMVKGRKLAPLRPDKDGYYTVPLAVLGGKSRNQTYYEPDAIIKHITDTTSRFNMTLTQGNLYGEGGHPTDVTPVRVMTIMEDRVSHHIRKIWTGETLEDGSVVILGLIKPHGPFGSYLEENLLSAYMNTSFSIRSLVKGWFDRDIGLQRRVVTKLITFDSVLMPGYEETSKRFSPAMENFGVTHELTADMFYKPDGQIACESWVTDKELLNLFGAKEIRLTREVHGLHMDGQACFIGDDGRKRSITHALLNGPRRK